MAYFNSERSKFYIDDVGGARRDLSPRLTGVSGLPGARALVDVTSLSDEGRAYAPGPDDGTVTLAGEFDDSDDSGVDAVLSALLRHPSPVAFEYAPAGSSPGSIAYKGECWVERYEVGSAEGKRVGFTAALRVEGRVYREIVGKDVSKTI